MTTETDLFGETINPSDRPARDTADRGGVPTKTGVPPMPPVTWPHERQPTPGEWIAYFLTLSGRQREYLVQNVLEHARRGVTCLMGMHDERLLNDTLTMAQIGVQAHLDDPEGSECPCCGQLAKRYRRKVTSQIARALIAMFRVDNQDRAGLDTGDLTARIDWGDARGRYVYVHLPTLLGRTADEAKAAYWNLIEPMPDVVREDGSTRTGWWRLTDHGRAYVRGETRIPKYALVYDGKLNGLDGPQVDIHDALGTRFNYTDLMAGV